MSIERKVVGIAAFAAITLLLSSVIDRPVDRLGEVPPAFSTVSPRCEATEASVLDLPEAPLSLFNNGAVHFLPCVHGAVSLVARGSQAAGRGPMMLISQKGANLLEHVVSAPLTTEVRVEAGFWVSIAFVNDASAEDGDRNLWIDQLSFARR